MARECSLFLKSNNMSPSVPFSSKPFMTLLTRVFLTSCLPMKLRVKSRSINGKGCRKLLVKRSKNLIIFRSVFGYPSSGDTNMNTSITLNSRTTLEEYIFGVPIIFFLRIPRFQYCFLRMHLICFFLIWID